MKLKLFFLTLFTLVALTSCEKISPYNIILDNRSDFDVTVELYTGTTNDDGSMFFDEYSVSANSKKTIGSDERTVYVDGYSPTESVNMDVHDSEGKIIFTNR
jgi:hypothetical protein